MYETPGTWPRVAAVLVATFLLVASGALATDGPTASIEVSPTTVRQGEAIAVRITVEGDGARDSRMLEPEGEAEGFERVGGVSTRQSFSWVNGRSTETKTFTLRYVAMGQGELHVPSFRIRVDERELATGSKTVRVLPRAASGQGAADPQEVVSVDLRLDEDRVYLGETLLAEVVLRSRVSIRAYEPSERLDPVPSFVVEDEQLNPSSTSRRFRDEQGREWAEYTLFRRQLTPTRVGALEVPPIAFQLQVVGPERRDSVFGGFFSRGRLKTIVRATPARTVTVEPLPTEGRPDDFSGLVGSLSVEASLDRHQTTIGQAVNLEVQLDAETPLVNVSAPSLRTPSDLQVFSPEEERASRDRWRWTYPLVPRAAGQLTFEGVDLSYFDPTTETYQRAKAGPFTLEVAPGRQEQVASSSTAMPAPKGPEPVSARATDLRFVHPVPSSPADRRRALRVPGWLWGAALLPPLAVPVVVALTLWLERYARSEAAQRLRLSRRVRSRLRRARKLAGSQPDEASRELIRAVHEWCEGVVGMSTRALDRARVRRLLIERLQDAQLADRVVACLDAAEGIRYTGGSGGERVARLVDEVEALSAGSLGR